MNSKAPYTALAPLYDKIMNHVKYDLWFRLIQNIESRLFPHKKPEILELGGGTGALAKMLIENGYSYLGSDYSHSMCREAHKKGLSFFCADARCLPVKKKFSLVIFLYDGINYFETLDDYTCLFNETHYHIDCNGYFLFDITTETNSINNFFDMIDGEDFGDSSYFRHSYFNNERKIQHNDFTIYTNYSKSSKNNSLYEKKSECHFQRIFSVDEILHAVPKNLFTVCGIWDNFSFDKYNKRSERIHFLLKKNL